MKGRKLNVNNRYVDSTTSSILENLENLVSSLECASEVAINLLRNHTMIVIPQ